MEIDGGLFQVAMAEQKLNGAQIGAGLEQMRGKAVPQRVRVDVFADAGAFGGFAAGMPHDLGRDGLVGGVPALPPGTARSPACGAAAGMLRSRRAASG